MIPAVRLVRAVLLLILGVALGFAGGYLVTTTSPAAELQRYELPANPMDLELVGGVGYATLDDGSIIRLSVDGDQVSWSIAAAGLAFPRGLAMAADAVYVLEAGELPCIAGDDCPADPAEREIQNIGSSSARIVSLPINDDGTLGAPVTVLQAIPVVTRDHSANDLDLGPDGMLYLAVGGVDYLWRSPDEFSRVGHPHPDWLGTVLRIDPETGAATVWAKGIRNVYGLAFGPDGRLFGVDNDGPTMTGWRHEELLELTEGSDYGYPTEGSFGPFEKRSAFPIYVLDSVGDAGIAWDGDGVVIGSCGTIQRVPFISPGDDYEVRDRENVETIAEIEGCATSIVPLTDGLLLAVYGVPPALYVMPRP